MTTFLFQAAFAASVTVNPGDDLNTLTSSLIPGDVVTFNEGVYELTSNLSVVGEGTEDAHISFVAASGATPVLKNLETGYVFEVRDSSYIDIRGLIFEGRDTWEEDGGEGLILSNSSFITVENCAIRNVRGTLLSLRGDGNNLEIRDNLLEFSSNGHGIYAGCGDGSCWLSGSTIANNLIHDLSSVDARYAIVLDNGSQDNRIDDNVVYNSTGHGIRVESTQFGDPNWIEGNAVWNGEGNGIEVLGAARVRNNVVFQMGGYGIRSSNHENDDLADTVITFNTIALTGDWAVRLEDWSDKPDMVFANNVVANITGRGFDYDSEDWTETDNRILGNVMSGFVDGVDVALFPDWYVPGAGVADFTDVESWDFYPTTSSTLLGTADPAGESWVPTTDFNGAPRNGEFPTVGAYEWAGDGNPGWIIQEGFKSAELSRDLGGDLGGGCCKGKEDGSEAFLLLPLLAFGLRRRKR